MSKRYRFFIVLAVLGVCFLFLLPSIRWYFFTTKDQQAVALESRQRISERLKPRAQMDVQRFVDAGLNNEELPPDLDFLIPLAKKQYKNLKKPIPEVWTARDISRAFTSMNEVREIIESRYRNEVFALKDLQRNAVKLGLDLSGGLSIVLQANLAPLEERLGRSLTDDDRVDAMNRVLDVLNSRIDQFGLTEPVIRRQGTDQIYVEIPGTADPERINDIIMGKGSLAFHMVDEEATEIFQRYYRINPTKTFDANRRLINPEIIPPDTMILGCFKKDQYGLDEQESNPDGSLRFIAVKREVGLDGNYIANATVHRNNLDGKPEIRFELSSESAEIFYALTSANIGKPLAIVLDDKVRAYPTIQAGLRDSGVISGFGSEEAENLALVLRTAALPVELEVVTQQSIGASMGEDAIRQGLYALIGGVIAVLVFMFAFYRTAGINAVVAQILNFYIMFSILSALNFTLTLPAIAGFILTIGMAVDSSVIIFERMKEEMRLGKSRKAVIEIGFDKAFWAIMDANITTFIAALFLSFLGSGPIRGFAVSLSIGVFSSVFTSLFVSRLIFDFGTDVLKSKNLSISWRIRINETKGVN
ncbi:MAG: protein translocase subunit SecD [Treponema sp.]|jgi:preprotein translocase subunit SecD|nr:protein translocase subunit SecD [Treponema sp.]